MARNEHHVVHNQNGGWDVKRNGAQRASVHTEKQRLNQFCIKYIQSMVSIPLVERPLFPDG